MENCSDNTKTVFVKECLGGCEAKYLCFTTKCCHHLESIVNVAAIDFRFYVVQCVLSSQFLSSTSVGANQYLCIHFWYYFNGLRGSPAIDN